MNTYILSLLVASLAAALVELLAPRGDGGRIASHVRMIAGLFLLVSLLSPLKVAVSYIRDVADGTLRDDLLAAYTPDIPAEDYEATFGATLASVGRDEVSAWVKTTLQDRFSVPPNNTTVEVVCLSNGETLTVSEVRIALIGSSVWKDPHPIEAYITEQLACPCYITVGT